MMEDELRERTRRIKNNVPVLHLLLGLAEECAELSQAALKLVRVFDGHNPTTKTEEEAIDDLYEEAADVILYLRTMQINDENIHQIMLDKAARWERRLAVSQEKRA